MAREVDWNEFKKFEWRAKQKWGERFDPSHLDMRFAPYLHQPAFRLHVHFGESIDKWGYIGVTTGWKPCFILMLTSRSTGSSWLLTPECEILEVRQRRWQT